MYEVRQGDCLAVMREMPDDSVDSVVTDPPYHLTNIVKRYSKTSVDGAGTNEVRAKGRTDALARLSRGFMGKEWDGGDLAFQPELWAEVLRVLKPGGHLLSFSGTRTYHRMACAIEDAGFEIRDQIGWTYGSGFPKSHDVSKGIDKTLGAERERAAPRSVIGHQRNIGNRRPYMDDPGHTTVSDVPVTAAAAEWQGWGTALKPAVESICFAQKPYTPQQFLATLVPKIRDLLCKVVLSEKMGTPLSVLLRESGLLNTASLLSESLAGLWGHENMCTTETAAVLTTDLKTLKSSLSRITHAITTKDTNQTNGAVSDVWVAAAISKNAQANCEKLTITTAGEIAIDRRAPPGTGPEGNRLSPNWEPICLARKPLSEKSVAANVLRWGTGALNIDGCRIEADGRPLREVAPLREGVEYHGNALEGRVDGSLQSSKAVGTTDLGRWPANIIHDGSEEVLALFPSNNGGDKRGKCNGSRPGGFANVGASSGGSEPCGQTYDDSGSAARFFYCAKASKKDRNYGLDGEVSNHPTVKPTDLMRYLCRLVTPPRGVVLDPFAGSGSTGLGALLSDFDFIGIEQDAGYAALAEKRIGALCSELGHDYI